MAMLFEKWSLIGGVSHSIGLSSQVSLFSTVLEQIVIIPSNVWSSGSSIYGHIFVTLYLII